jgi:hypothetical protein
MNATTANFINNILLEGLYLSLWVCFLAINIYRQQILIKEIDSLKKKQDILFESIQKLKIIIDIDKETEDIVSANVAILQNQLNDIDKRIEKRIEESNWGVRGVNPVEEGYNPVEEESNRGFNPVEEESDRGFPTFPHFTIFDDSNYISDNNKIPYKVMKADTRLLSNELARFLQKKQGVCITFAEAYDLISESLSLNSNDTNLKRLFGIISNDDNEITVDTLSAYLEPHLKKLIN